MTFSHSENDTPSNLHARRAPMVVCPLGMHRIPPFLIALPQRTTLNETRISKPLTTRYTLVPLTTKSTHSTPPIISTARTPPLAHPTLSHAPAHDDMQRSALHYMHAQNELCDHPQRATRCPRAPNSTHSTHSIAHTTGSLKSSLKTLYQTTLPTPAATLKSAPRPLR